MIMSGLMGDQSLRGTIIARHKLIVHFQIRRQDTGLIARVVHICSEKKRLSWFCRNNKTTQISVNQCFVVFDVQLTTIATFHAHDFEVCCVYVEKHTSVYNVRDVSVLTIYLRSNMLRKPRLQCM
jgi:hypothetical protein